MEKPNRLTDMCYREAEVRPTPFCAANVEVVWTVCGTYSIRLQMNEGRMETRRTGAQITSSQNADVKLRRGGRTTNRART